MDIKVLVAAHKAYRMPTDPIYMPIHVGKAKSTAELGFTGDNTGDNISKKNPTFCELTGIYWAYKNLKADYIGLSHYRRYFKGSSGKDKWDCILDGKTAEQVLQKTDVILPKKRHYYIETVYSQYVHAHPAEPLDLALKLAATQGKNYQAAVEKLKQRRWTHIYNMFIMKQDIFQAYCGWLFPILFEVEKQIDISGYSKYDQRVFGFLSERMLDIYLEANDISYQELPVMFMEKQDWFKKGTAFVKRKLKAGKGA